MLWKKVSNFCKPILLREIPAQNLGCLLKLQSILNSAGDITSVARNRKCFLNSF